MTALLQKAIERVRALPDDEQDRVAQLMLDAAQASNEADGQGEEEQKPFWERAVELMKDVPEEELEKLPVAQLMPDAAEAPDEADGLGEEERKPIWEKIRERAEKIPPEVWERLPKDGASEVDHYIYGTPKRNS